MNRRFAPSGCSRRAVHASGLAIGERLNLNVDIGQVDYVQSAEDRSANDLTIVG